jgi:cation transport regulator
MPERNKRNKVDDDIESSDEIEKRINHLPEHAQHIFKKAHASALKEYEDPKKR